MLLRVVRLKRTWIYAVAAVSLGVTWYALSSSGRTYANPAPLPYVPVEVPFTAGAPSADSLRSAPTYGTKIHFEDSAALAFARAEREDKLVLLLHLSGRFGSSEMT